MYSPPWVKCQTDPTESAGKLKHKNQPLQHVGIDIGYKNGTSLGGVNYMPVLVDAATGRTWIYGMHGYMMALWWFFIDVGGFLCKIQCEFERRGARSLAYSHHMG